MDEQKIRVQIELLKQMVPDTCKVIINLLEKYLASAEGLPAKRKCDKCDNSGTGEDMCNCDSVNKIIEDCTLALMKQKPAFGKGSLIERINNKMESILAQQKLDGKKFISDKDVDDLIQHVIDDEIKNKSIMKQKDELIQENERLAGRDCNATVQLVYDDGINPFEKEDLKVVDVGVADNVYVCKSEVLNKLLKSQGKQKEDLDVDAVAKFLKPLLLSIYFPSADLTRSGFLTATEAKDLAQAIVNKFKAPSKPREVPSVKNIIYALEVIKIKIDESMPEAKFLIEEYIARFKALKLNQESQ